VTLTTALAVLMVAGVAAVISYQHAYELVTSHGETGVTAHLLPFTVDGLIWAAAATSASKSPTASPWPTPGSSSPTASSSPSPCIRSLVTGTRTSSSTRRRDQ
jgi:hypothetical protein